MPNVQITSPSGTAAGNMELPSDIFECQVNVPLMHQVVTAQLAAARQGTQKTKSLRCLWWWKETLQAKRNW
jgi:large subunit ribosomal protein L4